MSLSFGTPAPMFHAPSPVNPQFAFASLGGRYLVLAFLPKPGPEREAALKAVMDQSEQFADDSRVFFGVLPDAESFAGAQDIPPLRWFCDSDGELARMFDAVSPEGVLIPQWVVIDPTLRILGTGTLNRGPAMLRRLAALGHPDNHAGVAMHAPVLIVPRVFEPEFCKQLIAVYAADGGTQSGVMRQKDGMTVAVLDDFKRRRDTTLTDPDLMSQVRARLARRLLPEIEKAFQFATTRIERYIVACYDAEDGGYFKPHRDNTTSATTHRRFAVSINLNAEEFEGGDLRFPEFGQRTYRPPTGGAVVFSCSLLHEATPVTRGCRYAYLPFLFDEAAHVIRAANLHLLAPSDSAEAGAG